MTPQTPHIRVGISVGDINGIGLEVILKTFEDNRMLELCTPIIFASNKIITFAKKQYNLQQSFNGITHLGGIVEGKINVMNLWRELPEIKLGEETTEGGKCAYESLKAATEALKEGTVDVLVTAPINKKNIQSEEFSFPGHTDYLAQELGGESLMLLLSDELRVGLLTDHLPISKVAQAIVPSLVEQKIRLANACLKQDFGIDRPKIALLGLNPHCGDGGVIGMEDEQILRPVVEKLFEEGILVFGPYSADSFFATEYTKFDLTLACYHDQGLAPFKAMSFGRGVNFTAGLNKVRTSPDHGTAYHIAGKGIAQEDSFREAVYKAIDIFRQRKQYSELMQNPLPYTQKYFG